MTDTTIYGRTVGQQITVIDARGTKGPGTITDIQPVSFKVRPDFPYFTSPDAEARPGGEKSWFFYTYETGDYGLKLIFEPFQPAPYDAGSPIPTETLFGTLITFEGTPLRDMDRDGLIRVIEYLGRKAEPQIFRPETLFA